MRELLIINCLSRILTALERLEERIDAIDYKIHGNDRPLGWHDEILDVRRSLNKLLEL